MMLREANHDNSSVPYVMQFWHPCRGAILLLIHDRGCRSAQPPANRYDPSGVELLVSARKCDWERWCVG